MFFALRYLLSFPLLLTLPVCLKVPSRDWLSAPKIGFSSLLAWVALTCISLSESSNFIPALSLYHIQRDRFWYLREKGDFYQIFDRPLLQTKNVAASSDPHDTVPSTRFFNTLCKKSVHIQNRDIWFYFVSVQRWVIGVKSTKLAAPLQYARCSFLYTLNNKKPAISCMPNNLKL